MTVVVPFAGSAEDLEHLLLQIRRLERGPLDEVFVVDNSGAETVPPDLDKGVQVLRTRHEFSSYHARNVGAARATNDWLLFMDADCRPSPDLLDAFFKPHAGQLCGAVAGEVNASTSDTLVGRYSESRDYLRQDIAFEHPFRPYAATVNVLVRREAWLDVGGFCEGVRSGGDTDFSWRLQSAGWFLEYRPAATVVHQHRDDLRGLLRQAARYGAARAWLDRRWAEWTPRREISVPAVSRAIVAGAVWVAAGQSERGAFRLLDALATVTGWSARILPNRPPGAPIGRSETVACAEEFPVSASGTASAAGVRAGTHIEAERRPLRVEAYRHRHLAIRYLEDDSWSERAIASLQLALSEPRRFGRSLRRAGRREAFALAAPARRIGASSVYPLDEAGRAYAHRLTRLRPQLSTRVTERSFP